MRASAAGEHASLTCATAAASHGVSDHTSARAAAAAFHGVGEPALLPPHQSVGEHASGALLSPHAPLYGADEHALLPPRC
jgi:hypothetical protein